MVLNSGGGNKGKHLARKFVKPGVSGGNKSVRVAQDEGEMYAVVAKLLGNCMCGVMCYDGKNRLCIIRKKFTGRRKTDNIVSAGSLILVGVHAFCGSSSSSSSSSSGSSSKAAAHPLQRCDLLYVYTDQEREKLRKVCDLGKLAAAASGSGAPGTDPSARGGGGGGGGGDDDTVKFVGSDSGIFNKYANRGASTAETVGVGASDAFASFETAATIGGADWLKDMYPESDDDDDDDDLKSSDDSSQEQQQPQQQQQQQPQQQQQRQPQPGRKPRADPINVDDI